MANRIELTQEYLRSILDYDPETGVFRWRWRDDVPLKWNARWAGKTTGSPSRGYLYIGINYETFAAHRLAFVYMTGSDPGPHVDHRDTDRSNNRWINLRSSTHSQNAANRQRNSNNTSCIKGVFWDKKSHKWLAAIGFRGRLINIGRYALKKEAAEAYAKAASELFGEFARSA